MIEQLNKEIIRAMKEKNDFRKMTLKMVKTELLNNQKEKKPRKELDVVSSYYKKLEKNLSIFKDTALEDLKKELDIIKEFMPKAPSKEELEQIINKYIDLKDFRQIIKAVKEEVAGFFDGKLVSSIIKGKLNE